MDREQSLAAAHDETVRRLTGAMRLSMQAAEVIGAQLGAIGHGAVTADWLQASRAAAVLTAAQQLAVALERRA